MVIDRSHQQKGSRETHSPYAIRYTHIGKNRIVICGGIECQTLKRVNMLDFVDGKITNLPSMLHERSVHAAAFFNSSILVAGGQMVIRKTTITTESMEM